MIEKPSENQGKLYNEVSNEYARMANLDPAKRFVQYPEALRLVGEVKNKKVLDIGCGNGTFTRMLAHQGAEVVAYDPSVEQIKEAARLEQEDKLGIKYFVSDRPAISPEAKFDQASAIMVLPCAVNQSQLEDLFKYANQSLKENGKFTCLTLNPEFKRFGEKVYNRRFVKRDDGNIGIDFFDEQGAVRLSIVDTNFSKAQVEAAAEKAGFDRVEWELLHVDPEGIKQQGAEFWDKFEEDCPYVGLSAYKQKI